MSKHSGLTARFLKSQGNYVLASSKAQRALGSSTKMIQVCVGVSGSDRKGALQSRPGTDYFERDCLKDESNPVFNAVRQPEGDDLFGPSMGSGMATFIPILFIFFQ